MADYELAEIESLRNQLQFSPERVRKAQLRRAEKLIAEFDSNAQIPFGYVHLSITGHRLQSSNPAALLPAHKLRRDLLKLLVDLSEDLDIAPDEEKEPVYTLTQAAARCRVSVKTIRRWRTLGLPTRKFLFPARVKMLGITRSALTAFLKRNPKTVLRARHFKRLSEPEQKDISSAARKLARQGLRQTRIAKDLAEQFSRSPETIRQVLKRLYADNPEDEALARLRGNLSDEEKELAFQRVEKGASPTKVARELGVDRSSVYRAYYKRKAEQELETHLSYIWCDDFQRPDADEFIASAAPEPALDELEFTAKSLDDYLRSFQRIAVLSAADEHALFRRYNYAKYRLARIQALLGAEKPSAALLREIAQYKEMTLRTKNALVFSNMRLVMSVARRHAGRFVRMPELMSDGTLALLAAVEKFDYTRGTRFSTYATWVLIRRFARLIPEENYQFDTFLTGRPELIASIESTGRSEGWGQSLSRLLQRLIGLLPEREQRVITSRYGLEPGGRPRSLREVGEREGLSGERVRQLETQAFRRLRELLEDESLELPHDWA